MDYICEFSIKNFYEGTIRHITTVLNYCANYNMSFCTQATMNKPDGTWYRARTSQKAILKSVQGHYLLAQYTGLNFPRTDL